MIHRMGAEVGIKTQATKAWWRKDAGCANDATGGKVRISKVNKENISEPGVNLVGSGDDQGARSAR